MNVTRRHVAAALAALPLIGAMGAGGLYLRWWDRPPGAAHQALSDDEYATIQALAEAWMPAGGLPHLSGADAKVGVFVDDLVAHLPHPERELIKLLIQALDDATLPRHFAGFRSLDRETRTMVVKKWLASDVIEERTAVRALLLLIAEGWVQHPDVLAALGGEFPCGYGA